jgi:long-chain acyl-CoA synthetase
LAFGLAPIYFGAHMAILQKFEPDIVLEHLAAEPVTGVFMVPTHFHGIFALEEKLFRRRPSLSLKSIISNAAPLPQATKEQIVGYFGDGILHETYGSTEAGIVSNLRPPDQLRKQKCVGQPFPATEIQLFNEFGKRCAVGEVGELYSNSPYLFNGYWKKPDETVAAFRGDWLTVGDLAVQDEEGYFYIVDRKKDMVISGGINVYPREIEEVLMRHPKILEAAVIGVPDEKWGEVLKAFVVLRPGHSFDVAELSSFCESKIAKFKVPKLFVMSDALPRNASGKVLKGQLRSS